MFSPFSSEDSGKDSLSDSGDSDSDVDPENTGPSKTSRRALFFCELCTVDCNSLEALQNHFAGTKHQKKLSLNGLSSNLQNKYDIKYEDELSGKVVECTLCGIVFHGLERAIHFKSENHTALCNFTTDQSDHSKWIKVIGDAPPEPPEGEVVDVDAPEKVSDGYLCKLCSTTLNTEAMFQTHVEGKRHQKKARWHYLCTEGDVSDVNQYWCRLCNLFCTDREALTMHYRGRNHLRVLKLIKPDEPVLDGKADAPQSKKPTRKKRDTPSVSNGGHSKSETAAKREWVDKVPVKRGEVDPVRVKKERAEQAQDPVHIKCEPIDEKDEETRVKDVKKEPMDTIEIKQEPEAVVFHSSRNSKRRSYRNSRGESPVFIDSLPSNFMKERSHSPRGTHVRSSHRSPDGRKYSSSKHSHNSRKSRSRSRSHSRDRRHSSKKDHGAGGRRKSSTSHSRSTKHSSDSDSTADRRSQSSSLSRGRSQHKSYGQRHHSSTDSHTQSSSSFRSRYQDGGRRSSHRRSRSRSHSRERRRNHSRSHNGHSHSDSRYDKRGKGRYHERSPSRRRYSHRERVEPPSEEDEVPGLNFDGFSGEPVSDDEGAPPISSLSVSYILNALLKASNKH